MKIKNLAIGSIIAGIMMFATVISAGAVCVGVGTVSGDGLRLRKSAGIEAKVLATANKGDTVVVLEEEDGWYKVDFDTQVGYMSAGYVEVETSVEKDLGWAKVTTSGSTLNLRSGAGTECSVVTKLSNGVSVKVTGVKDGWYKITYNGKEGYASSDYITLTQNEEGSRKDGDVVETSGSTLGQSIVAEAMKHVGKRYVRGGKGPNVFDCSGFTYYCVKQASGGRIKLSGGASNQWHTAPGQRIKSVSELQPGDLIFIRDPAYAKKGYAASHVEIYAGNGMIVHAADSRKGVVNVPLRAKDISYFIGAVRLG